MRDHDEPGDHGRQLDRPDRGLQADFGQGRQSEAGPVIRNFSLVRLWRDRRGATAVEFAILLAPMLILLMGALDVAYQLYATAVLQGTVHQASRRASLEDANQTTIDTFVRTSLASITSANNIEIAAVSYRDFTGVGNPEKIVTDTAPIGTINVGDCWIDANKNGLYDSQQGGSGLGGAEDVVNYTVTMKYNRITPITKWLGWGNVATITRSTSLQNEPYAGVIDPPKVCKT
ncbi:TadE/TadG family type IV pilus assembly protein [Sphingomonas colocasiae]|uniref:Pilus assembly protein n=1 Tax=Sphingomonas colocasiae TaxID=1848973 RepID=A0ABS7PHB0_9SPHN|nr:TadE/TadG family type IV pilus assembly protein [Sphingomonas colocasiae]MBY8820690.1 pilus assembly protein [Sphingomonas colocasiae]